MPELQYKFKSSLSFETIKFNENTITVGGLKELINKKQSLKTNGFDLKLKDSEGKIYTEDDEIIDYKHRIVVSRFPKSIKPNINIKKKEPVVCLVKPLTNTVIPPEIDQNLSRESAGATRTIEAIITTKIPNVPTPVPVTDTAPAPASSITPDYLKCALCHKTMIDATKINCCATNYCYECITGYLFDPDVSGAMECPKCKSTVSNSEANITENAEIRAIIVALGRSTQNGTASDACVYDRLEDDGPFVAVDIEVQEVDVTTSSPPVEDGHCNEEGAAVCSSPNTREEAVVTETSRVEVMDIPVKPEATQYQIETHPPERAARPAQTRASPIKEALVRDAVDTQVPPVRSNSASKRTQREDQHNTPVAVKASSKGAPEPSIKELEFDPVLYMKFLKIVGESYPEELRKILSGSGSSTQGNGSSGGGGAPTSHRSSHKTARHPQSQQHNHQDGEADAKATATVTTSAKRPRREEAVPLQEHRRQHNEEWAAQPPSSSSSRRANGNGGGGGSGGSSAVAKRYRSRSRSREQHSRQQQAPPPPAAHDDDRRRHSNKYHGNSGGGSKYGGSRR